MKTTRIVLLALLPALAMPNQIVAEYCFMLSCYYETDGVFANGGAYWVESLGVTYPTVTVCGSSSKRVQLGPGQEIEQTFDVDASYTSFDVTLKPYLINDTDNYFDELTVTATNNDNSQSEFSRWRGSTFNNNCNSQVVTFTLQNDYSNSNVTLKFRVGSLSASSWYVDNIQFGGHQF